MLRPRPSGRRGLTALAAPQKKEAGGKKLYEDKGKPSAADEGPLDDPVAEKLRQQKCAAQQRRGSAARHACGPAAARLPRTLPVLAVGKRAAPDELTQRAKACGLGARAAAS